MGGPGLCCGVAATAGGDIWAEDFSCAFVVVFCAAVEAGPDESGASEVLQFAISAEAAQRCHVFGCVLSRL